MFKMHGQPREAPERSCEITERSEPLLVGSEDRCPFDIKVGCEPARKIRLQPMRTVVVEVFCVQIARGFFERGDRNFRAGLDDGSYMLPHFESAAGQRKAEKPIDILKSPQHQV